MSPANPRHPLTLRYARSAAETQRDPYAWFEGKAEPVHVAAIGRRLTFRNQPSLLRRLAKRLGF